MINTKQIEQSISPLLLEAITESFNNLLNIENVISKSFKEISGHYVILCDKPVPGKDTTKWGDYFLWYNGTSVKVKARLKSHLYRHTQKQRMGASNAIAVNVVCNLSYDSFVKEGSIRVKDDNYFKHTEDGTGRYLNGINFKEFDGQFKVAIIETEYLADAIEKMFREEIGKPVLCQYDKR